jgi:hypothetical protein
VRYDLVPGTGINFNDHQELEIALRIFEAGELEPLVTLYLPGEFETVRSEETLDRLRVVCRARRV